MASKIAAELLPVNGRTPVNFRIARHQRKTSQFEHPTRFPKLAPVTCTPPFPMLFREWSMVITNSCRLAERTSPIDLSQSEIKHLSVAAVGDEDIG